MPESVKALREKALPLVKRIGELRDLLTDQHPDFTAEEKEQWDKVNKEYDVLRTRLTVAERADEIDRELRQPVDDDLPIPANYDPAREQKKRDKDAKHQQRQERLQAKRQRELGWLAPSITEEDRCNALQAWCRAQTGRPLKWYHRHACRKTGMNPKRREIGLGLPRDYRSVLKMAAEHRALALNANAAAGYTVPEGFVNNLEIALLAYAEVRKWATVMRTASGQDLPWPTVNDTTNKGAILVENATVGQQDVTFQQVVFHAYKYTSKMVLVPVELMEDSAFDLAATLGQLLGIRIGRIQADHFTTGSGASQPQGYLIGATSGVTAASSTAIGGDDLYKLKHSVDPAYRSQPGVGWTFHDLILQSIKLLKDGSGRYLWQSGLAGGVPDTIDGDPFYINQSMASTIASGNKTVVYGALKKYVVRDVSQVRMRRLVERFADSDQEAFLMFMRSDANLLDAGTHPIKYLVH